MILLKDALRNLVYRKRLPKTCNHCYITCVLCRKTLEETGRMSSYQYNRRDNDSFRNIVPCYECRHKITDKTSSLYCPVLDIKINPGDKPRCTKYDINKKMMEVI